MGMTTFSLLLLLVYRGIKLKVSNKSDAKRGKRETTFILGATKDSLTTVVALTMKDDVKKQVFCSGNILSKTFIATAASCMDKIKDEDGNLNVEILEVVAGKAKMLNYKRDEKDLEEKFSVKRAIVHPHYDKEKNGNMVWDLALLELTEEMDLESKQWMEAAVLPPSELRLTGREVTLGGWGQSDGIPDLQVTNITVLSDEICERKYQDSFDKENMFCAGTSDTTECHGDSGSGALLYVNGKIFLLGVVSFGHDSKCRGKVVFLSVGKNLPWIFKETGLMYVRRCI